MEQRYLIIGALDQEVNALVERMSGAEKHSLHGVDFYSGELGGQRVLVAQSGIGKVNASFTTTVLINAFNPVEIINIGSAGGLIENQNVGDIVVATELRYHDFYIGLDTYEDERFIFKSQNDEIEGVLKSLELPYHTGLIVSGDQFVTKGSTSFINIRNNFKNAIAVEMEATAIAAICSKFDLKFIVLRALSDVTHTDGNELQFDQYLELASRNSSLICETYLKNKNPIS